MWRGLRWDSGAKTAVTITVKPSAIERANFLIRESSSLDVGKGQTSSPFYTAKGMQLGWIIDVPVLRLLGTSLSLEGPCEWHIQQPWKSLRTFQRRAVLSSDHKAVFLRP
jgi:hypothetical protein